MAPYDFAFNFVLVGDPLSGKTSLNLRFTHGTFHVNTASQRRRFFSHRTVEVGGQLVQVRISDDVESGGMTKAAYSHAHGAMVCCDLTNPDALDNVHAWIRDIEANAPENVPIMIVGTKSDLLSERAISHKDLKDFANAVGSDFYETSAKTGNGVLEVFQAMAGNAVDYKAPDAIPKKVLTLTWSPGEAGRAVVCTNLGGDKVITLDLNEGTTLGNLLASLSQHLQTARWELRLVLPSGKCLSREQCRMPLITLLGMDS
mmetsp:Transcript_9816/g.20814  ORF Transcript_9816/g.20814 Transcript_9816/m.20814 type:complete len:259 (-) Transcript_9816:264-1040(-)